MTDETKPEQPPEPTEMEQLRDSVSALQTMVNRVREAIGTDEPAPVRESYRIRELETRASDAEYERGLARRRAEEAEAALVRVHHLAAAIHAGAPWTASHAETAARIRGAITGPGTLVAEETVSRALFEETARRHKGAIARVDELLATTERVRALHQPQPDGTGFDDGQQCRTCSQDGGDGYQYLVPWPCPTVRALDEPAPAATEATDNHVYLSTGCLHGEHAYCQSHTGHSGTKTPAACKFCAAPCTCGCHTETPRMTAAELETTVRVVSALHRAAEDTVTRVIDLYEQWVAAGPPPLGTSMSRWWDTRLVELHNAIQPPAREQRERPTHPDGTPYRHHEIKAEGWEHCDGCRLWGQGWTAESPHQCTNDRVQPADQTTEK
ncbi:hypothetical protein ACIQFU_22980 [Streptomyces sp. NPDC093065]|uniref:hypothetical protein n=1 Tax=Streptomyces sp. NPDC093065 TaxID=3366021 RepID=UPI0038091F66